jgi:hypothetical protein
MSRLKKTRYMFLHSYEKPSFTPTQCGYIYVYVYIYIYIYITYIYVATCEVSGVAHSLLALIPFGNV